MKTDMSPRNGDPEGEGDGRGGRGSRSHGQRPSSSRGGLTEDYRRRRDRNNLAVKRSRVRSKLRTQETLERVRTLKAENEALEGKIQSLGRELGFLKELFIAHAGAGTAINTSDLNLEELLKENAYDDLLDISSNDQMSRSSHSSRRDFKAESAGDGDTEDSEPHAPS